MTQAANLQEDSHRAALVACRLSQTTMDIKPIRTKTNHRAALRLVSRLVDLDPARGTPDGDMLDVMSTLVAAYEAKHIPIALADPIEAIKFRMDQRGLVPRDLQHVQAEP